LSSRTMVVSSRSSCPAASPPLRLLRPRLLRRSRRLLRGAPAPEGESELAGDIRGAPRCRQRPRGRCPRLTGPRRPAVDDPFQPLRLVPDPLKTFLQFLEDPALVHHERAGSHLLDPAEDVFQPLRRDRVELVLVDEPPVLVEPADEIGRASCRERGVVAV